ncbi:hypothetical protein MKW94_020424, partial [Papaver nudicaule]|nr:hypothetical protein [Papaver nudicaule]
CPHDEGPPEYPFCDESISTCHILVHLDSGIRLQLNFIFSVISYRPNALANS